MVFWEVIEFLLNSEGKVRAASIISDGSYSKPQPSNLQYSIECESLVNDTTEKKELSNSNV